jgi:deoxyribonuclease-1-like protein
MKKKQIVKLLFDMLFMGFLSIILIPVWALKKLIEKLKKKETKLIVSFILIVFLSTSLSGCQEEKPKNIDTDYPVATSGQLSIACWNLQIFGPTKASNDTLVSYYAEKLDDHDIFVVQGIRDISGEAIKKLASKVPGYDYILSERAGKSTSKEQYAVFYRTNITRVDYKDYTNQYQPMFQRPPLKIRFRKEKWNFTLYTIHTSPDSVYQEMGYFESVVGSTDEDIVIIGDMNMDGSYYDETNITHFTSWTYGIPNQEDTTVAKSDNTYDRIIFNNYAKNNFENYGIMKDVNEEQSDHYLIYGIFNTNEK